MCDKVLYLCILILHMYLWVFAISFGVTMCISMHVQMCVLIYGGFDKCGPMFFDMYVYAFVFGEFVLEYEYL